MTENPTAVKSKFEVKDIVWCYISEDNILRGQIVWVYSDIGDGAAIYQVRVANTMEGPKYLKEKDIAYNLSDFE